MDVAIASGVILGSSVVSQKILGKIKDMMKMGLAMLFYGTIMCFVSFFVTNFWVLLPLGLGAIFLGVIQTIIYPLIQKITEKTQQGKIFAAFETLTVGIIPLGSILFGFIAKFLVPQIFFLIYGFYYIFLAIIFILIIKKYNFS
ncbi:hypothetical protein GHI93_00610 [Lactococcus hircilactis]|uniref:MFS transporter n=1 Tax=Lactococcus hircilactis TaxID=1494462 RepID=A0A7X2CZR8_9LACT|nr:hypothetical protein [Lactococcus hircilactis]MQW38451.1 hypothetical protein [Lactococcus hircilactis]